VFTKNYRTLGFGYNEPPYPSLGIINLQGINTSSSEISFLQFRKSVTKWAFVASLLSLKQMASLTIFDTETEGSVVFYSPMSSAALKGCHDVQNLGAVQTYLRRYLWTNAFEIVEHDALDASTGSVEPVKQEVKPTPKPVERKSIEGSGDWAMVTKTPPEGDATEWLTVIDQTASMGLELAKTKDDVMAIYKSNKQLFDAVKTKSPDFFSEMMKKFSERKAELEGA
jgi:hypothetical protein